MGSSVSQGLRWRLGTSRMRNVVASCAAAAGLTAALAVAALPSAAWADAADEGVVDPL